MGKRLVVGAPSVGSVHPGSVLGEGLVGKRLVVGVCQWGLKELNGTMLLWTLHHLIWCGRV